MQLTDAGRLLADHAVGLPSLARRTELALAGLSGRPRARVLVGVFGTAAALLPRALLRVREDCPRVRLRSVEVDVDDATSAVAAGRVDLALGVDYLALGVDYPRAPVTDLVLALRREGLATVPLTDRVERTMVLAHRREPAPQPGVRAVIDAIRLPIPDHRLTPPCRGHGPSVG